jgi:hypothetical protein
MFYLYNVAMSEKTAIFITVFASCNVSYQGLFTSCASTLELLMPVSKTCCQCFSTMGEVYELRMQLINLCCKHVKYRYRELYIPAELPHLNLVKLRNAEDLKLAFLRATVE